MSSSSSSSYQQFAHLKIPLEEILSATNNFSDANLIAESAFKTAYRGQLLRSDQQIHIVADRLHHKDGDKKKDMFWTEISTLSSLDHENMVSVFGLCDEKDEKIIIYKLKAKGSLHTFLGDRGLTWAKRLEICVGVGRALYELKYLASEPQRDSTIIHRNISSCNILLDDIWKPKLSGFEHSVEIDLNRGLEPRGLDSDVTGVRGYIDPSYEKFGWVDCCSEVYSFGVVLFEVLCGRRAYVSQLDKPSDQLTKRPLLTAPVAKFYYENKKLDELVDPGVWEEMDPKSFMIFSKIAYECLKEKPSNRPDIALIREILEESLDLQTEHENLKKNSELLCIGLKDIELATENFLEKNIIGSGGFGTVYKAERKHYDNRNSMAPDEGKGMQDLLKTKSIVAIKCIKDEGGEEGFSAEIKMLGNCKHRNIVSLLGFCDEGSRKMLVYEYVSRGSLDNYLEMTNEMKKIKWEQRLQMCLDIAQGLKYLHTKKKIIHRDIKSANILFDDNWVAKIADFGLSKIGPMNQEVSYLDTRVAGTCVYLDPEYEKTKELREASDIYSLGIVLFEIMSGTLAYDTRYIKENEKGLAPFARQQYVQKGTLTDMLDPNLKEEIVENIVAPSKGPNQDSVDIFFGIAYKCLAETRAQRPDIGTVVDKLKEAIHSQNNSKSKHQISLGAINLAIDNFNDNNRMGRGGFGRYYKGKTTNVEGNHINIVVQRLDKFGNEGKTKFWTELEILQKYRHENVIGVLGYCDESDEKIIVYEYASRGSLDAHLKDTDLTWKQRLQICIDVASGLYFLHGGGKGEEYVIHGDIKSSKILLDKDWKAKLCDFGFSVLTHQKNTEFVIDKAHSTTDLYDDPSYKRFGLTKESDIYWFGYLLAEICTGLLLSEFRNHSFASDSFADAVFEGIKESVAPKSSAVFVKLFMECVQPELQKRPTIGDVLLRITQALEFQVDYEIWKPKLPIDCEQIFKMSNSQEDYETEKEEFIYHMLVKGILLQESEMLFTLGNNGERNLMTSAKTFSYVNRSLRRWCSISESRFQETAKMLDILNLNIKIKTRTQLLSPNVDYGIYLVFKFCEPKIISSEHFYVNLKYKYENKTSHAYFATQRENEWMMIELVRFLNTSEDKDFEFLLESFSQRNCGDSTIYIEGIEFRPIIHASLIKKYEETKGLKKVQQVLKLNSDMDLMQELSTNYQEILMRIESDDGGEELYWLHEVDGKKHLMLSAKAALNDYYDVKHFKTIPSTQSRFSEVIKLLPQQVFWINCAVKIRMLSRDIDYACYLVFRLSEKCHGLYCPIKVQELLHSTDKNTKIIYFRSPSPWNLHDIDQTPEQRVDGWMEVRVWKFNLNYEFEDDYLHVNLRLDSCEEAMSDLVICGLEFRPM